jgi:hypothetical protein
MPCLTNWSLPLMSIGCVAVTCCVRCQVCQTRVPIAVRHQMTTILGLALCAVLAGARSFTAIGEWAANASPQVLSARVR